MDDTPTPRKKSQKRQRNHQVKTNLLDDEFNAVAEKADAAGLSMGAYLRAAMLGNPGPRAQRRLSGDAQLLRQVLGQLGRIGNNLNQIAYNLNAGENPHTQMPELAEALRDYMRMRDTLYEALGKQPDSPAPSQPEERRPNA